MPYLNNIHHENNKIDKNKLHLLKNIKENYKNGNVEIEVEQLNPFQLTLTITK